MVPNKDIRPDYNRFPYGNYKTNNGYILFGLKEQLRDIPNKERLISNINSAMNNMINDGFIDKIQDKYYR